MRTIPRYLTQILHPIKPSSLKPSTLPLSTQSTPQNPTLFKPPIQPTSIISMEEAQAQAQTHTQAQFPSDPKSSSQYPTPSSPPLPLISKEIELQRAMNASSRSNLFTLSRNHVIFEDQWLLVVNKPSGVYCESVLSSVPQLLLQSPDSVEASEFHLANRLDRDTSGVMVITKLHKVAGKLVKAFTEHKVQKTYIALCIGAAPKWDKIRLISGHGRSKYGAWRVYAASDVGRKLPGGSMVRSMETLFELLSVNRILRFKESSEAAKDQEKTIVIEEKSSTDANQGVDKVLVRAFPKSGRTHQIRLHCQYLGLSIKGDVKYEGVCEWEGGVCDFHNLHAENLSLEHPVTGLPVQFRAPLPPWATEAMQL